MPIRRSTNVNFLGQVEKNHFFNALFCVPTARKFYFKGVNIMKKIVKALLTIFATIFMLNLVACNEPEKLVIKESDTYIVITASTEQMAISETTTLLDYMQSLKSKGELNFEIVDGMIVSVNGFENAADYSSCWMLYTDDAELSNKAWGTVEYQDEELGSAMFGAETLTIKNGCKYIWVYQTF